MRLLPKKIVVAIFLTMAAVAPAHGGEKINNNTYREQSLGPINLGESQESVKAKLMRLGNYNMYGYIGNFYRDNWSAWIDSKNVLTGISYFEQQGIKKSFNYPKTSRSISIGDKVDDVVHIYGSPEQKLTLRSPFVLKNSELSLIYVYPTKGLWIQFINQQAYSGNHDWRVIFILLGNEDVIAYMYRGAQTYAMNPITSDDKKHISSDYEKKYGNSKELEIFDEYVFNFEVANILSNS